MAPANRSPDWLPAGWKMQNKVSSGRKFKCYINIKTGKKVYSKPAVMRLANNRRGSSRKAQLMNGHARTTGSNRGQSVMDTNHSPDWLPDGWRMELRTRKSGMRMGQLYKCYIDPSTGNSFYSKQEVLRHLDKKQQCNAGLSRRKKTRGSVKNSSSILLSKTPKSDAEQKELEYQEPHEQKVGSSKSSKLLSKAPESDEERNEQEYQERHEQKYYSSSSKSYALRSRGQKSDAEQNVQHYQEQREPKVDSSKSSALLSRGQKSELELKQPQCQEAHEQNIDSSKVIVEKVIDERLPPGWIKEIRIKKTSDKVRKDPFYTDPISGYVFRSRLDVLRYLETGEISRHAYKRKDWGTNNLEKTDENPSASPSAKRNKSTKSIASRRLFEGEGISEGSPLLEAGKEISIGGLSPRQDPVTNSPKAVRKKVKQSAEKNACNVESEILSRPARLEAQGRSQNGNDVVQMYGDEHASTPSKSTGTLLEQKNTKCLERTPIKKLMTGSSLKDDLLTKMPECSVELKRAINPSDEPATVDYSQTGKSNCLKIQVPPQEVQDQMGCEITKIVACELDESGERKGRKSQSTNSIRKTKECISPHRSSKRLAGIRAEPVIHSKPIETVLRSSAKKAGKVEPFSSYQENPSPVSSGPLEKITPASSVLPQAQVIKDPLSNDDGGRLDVNKAIGKDSEVCFSSAIWTDDDPCLEFAIKTLTGALPLDDNLAIHDYVEHQLRTSSAKNDIDRKLLDVGPPPGFSWSDVSALSVQNKTEPTLFFPPPGFSRSDCSVLSVQNKTNPKLLLDVGPPPGFSKDTVSSQSTTSWPPQSEVKPVDHGGGCSLRKNGNTVGPFDLGLDLDLGPPPGFSQNNGSSRSNVSEPKQLDLGPPPGFSQNNGSSRSHVLEPEQLDLGPPPGFSLNKASSRSDVSEPKPLEVIPLDTHAVHCSLQQNGGRIDPTLLDMGPPPGFPNKVSSQLNMSSFPQCLSLGNLMGTNSKDFSASGSPKY